MSLFEQFAPEIRNLRLSTVTSAPTIPDAFCLDADGILKSHYIPFDHVNATARIVIVGITPGFTQWKNAMQEAQQQLALGADPHTALIAAKSTGAFSGSMRPLLIALLDHIGLNEWLGLPSCAALFDDAAHLVQTTSILRHPIFVHAQNYAGDPPMLRVPFLQKQIEAHFMGEAEQLRNAVFVPLGPKVADGLMWLAERGVIDRDRLLGGLPHPSRANIERIMYFLGQKDRAALSNRTNAKVLDVRREVLMDMVRALPKAGALQACTTRFPTVVSTKTMTDRNSNMRDRLTTLDPMDLIATLIAHQSAIRALSDLKRRGITEANLEAIIREMSEGVALVEAEADKRNQSLPRLVSEVVNGRPTTH